MPKQNKDMHSEMTNDYIVRSLHNRFGTLANATMNMVGYFINLGKTYSEAQLQVDQISFVMFGNDSFVFGYIMGSVTCRSAFFDKINNIDEVTYPFMDSDAKSFLINELTV